MLCRIHRPTTTRDRRGSILPLFAISLVMLLGFVALSIDLGVMSVAKTQCQNAADASALAGARTLTGITSGNTAQATTNALAAAAANTVLCKNVQTTGVNVQHGSYHYSSSTQLFSPAIPKYSTDNYNLTQSTITYSNPTSFARIFNISTFNLTATATAANRPRDVAIVLDFSGSMNNESDIWNCESYLGSMQNTPNNTDTVFPQWGWYAPSYSPGATLQCTSTNTLVGYCNITTGVQGVPAMVNDFYSNARGAGAASAFAAAPSTVTNTTPGGDANLLKSGGSQPALTWLDVVGSTSTQYTGYPGFKGYTQGPGYWGKTFFAWPPDPNAANDWRKKFFFLSDGATPCNDNSQLYDSGGNWQTPSGSNYVVNYKAILAWINSAPSIFPTQLRRGRDLLHRDSHGRARQRLQLRLCQRKHQRPQSAVLEGIYRFRAGHLEGPVRQYAGAGNVDVQLWSGFSSRHRIDLHLRPGRGSAGPDRHLLWPQRQSAAAAASVLVWSDDHDPVHDGHRQVARHGA